MTDNNLITVTEFANYAPDVDTSKYTEPTISGMISQASKAVSTYLGYTPLAEDITDELKEAVITIDGDLLIRPQKTPIQSVSTIKIAKGATDVTLTIVDGSGTPKYNIDYTKRSILYPYNEITLQGVPVFTDFYALRGSHFYVKLTYRGGFEVLPADIQQATVLIMQDIIGQRYNQVGAKRLTQGGITFEFSQSSDGESELVKKAKKLLNPYRRI